MQTPMMGHNLSLHNADFSNGQFLVPLGNTSASINQTNVDEYKAIGTTLLTSGRALWKSEPYNSDQNGGDVSCHHASPVVVDSGWLVGQSTASSNHLSAEFIHPDSPTPLSDYRTTNEVQVNKLVKIEKFDYSFRKTWQLTTSYKHHSSDNDQVDYVQWKRSVSINGNTKDNWDLLILSIQKEHLHNLLQEWRNQHKLPAIEIPTDPVGLSLAISQTIQEELSEQFKLGFEIQYGVSKNKTHAHKTTSITKDKDSGLLIPQDPREDYESFTVKSINKNTNRIPNEETDDFNIHYYNHRSNIFITFFKQDQEDQYLSPFLLWLGSLIKGSTTIFEIQPQGNQVK